MRFTTSDFTNRSSIRSRTDGNRIAYFDSLASSRRAKSAALSRVRSSNTFSQTRAASRRPSWQKTSWATPTGTSYRVDYSLDNGNQYTETWVVPASSTPLAVSTVRVGLPPQPGGTISQSQVEGLVAELGDKPDVDAANVFTQQQTLRESFDGQPLLGFEKSDGEDGVYFKLPSLEASATYTLPVADGLPNQQLTTDGNGRLFWSTAGAGAGAGGSAIEVVQSSGFTLTQRNVLNFANGLLAFDEEQNTRTTVQPLYGFTAGTITQGNDFRLSNARTPLAHKSTHQIGGSDPID